MRDLLQPRRRGRVKYKIRVLSARQSRTKTSGKSPPGEHSVRRSTGTSEARNGRRNPESISKTVKKKKEEKPNATRRGVARWERDEGGEGLREGSPGRPWSQ